VYIFQEEDMDAKELGCQVQAKRKERDISQTELGRLAGVSRNYISLIERGEANNISMKVVNRLAVALGASPAELTGEISLVMIPPSLRELGIQKNLPYEVVDKLAQIPRRGKEPKTAKEWEELYEAINRFIDTGNEQ
jgi:transcriptional regulator with XRE-family HTH domain